MDSPESLGISRMAAQDFIDRYNATYPGIATFFNECVDQAKALGYAETMLGRRRQIPELNSRNRQQVSLGQRLAVNTVIQGTAADLIKRAMIDIHQEIKDRDLPLRMLVQVHDELVFESPAQEADAHIAMITTEDDRSPASGCPHSRRHRRRKQLACRQITHHLQFKDYSYDSSVKNRNPPEAAALG